MKYWLLFAQPASLRWMCIAGRPLLAVLPQCVCEHAQYLSELHKDDEEDEESMITVCYDNYHRFRGALAAAKRNCFEFAEDQSRFAADMREALEHSSSGGRRLNDLDFRMKLYKHCSVARFFDRVDAVKKFPVMFRVCLNHLGLLGSSASVERLFSTLNNVLSKLRTRTDPNLIELQTLMRHCAAWKNSENRRGSLA